MAIASPGPSIDRDDYFMAIAFLTAKLSSDPVTRVGACIVKDDVVVGIGYNRMPRNSKSKFSWKKDNPDPLKNKYPYVCHAAMVAICNKNSVDVKDSTMYISMFPCNECAKLIVENGIKEVVYLSDKYKDEIPTVASKLIFDAAKVIFRRIKLKNPKIVISFSDINAVSMDIDYRENI
ncbi:deoxycytidylate deaminase-like [Agrilus planipennis]|uniref:Probable deoxycytidylate deaminase n=1 Tax=Agrilus planipennis TaxID=224129 RepID=A0A7F5RH11_AGRPL|nr:deoxycytidylate deaminase-like [Agrilus planipennis]